VRVAHQDLQSVLEKQLASVYVVYGEETLLAEEACNSIRAAARNNGFDDRELMVVERGFDWERLNQAGESLSLFSQKRLLELRIPGSKPGDQGSKAMTRYCENVPEDTLLLVWCGKLDRAQLNSKWFKALDSTGVSVGVQPVSAQQLPNWIAQRLKKHGLEPGPGVPELLAYRYEGNLLAAAQEAEKLALLFEGSVSAEQIQAGLGDDARFDVFGFVDTCLAGNGPAAVRALQGLRAEGIAPSLVLWAMTREIRLLEQCATGIASGEQESQVFSHYRIWQKKQPLFRAALKRGRPARWRALLQAAARADRVIKGRAPGIDWQALQALGLGLAGVRIG
jgi:DNA polymerase-3 subunit delta